MAATTAIDIYDVVGTWRDSCEYGQLDRLLPMFTVLFGDVTWKARDDVAVEATSFYDWLMSI